MLEALHPSAPPPERAQRVAAHDKSPEEFGAERFGSVLHELARGTATGPVGGHTSTRALQDERTVETLRGVFNDMPSWTIPHSDLLKASRLVAIAKPHSALRPIAIGEAILRVASICPLACVPEVPALLTPHQFGVRIQGGAKIPVNFLLPADIHGDCAARSGKRMQLGQSPVHARRGGQMRPRPVRIHQAGIWCAFSAAHAPVRRRQCSPIEQSRHRARWPPWPSALCAGLLFHPPVRARKSPGHTGDCMPQRHVQGDTQPVIDAAVQVLSRHASMRRKKVLICTHEDAVRHTAACMGATVASDGITVCGAALGSSDLITAHARCQCRAAKLMGNLVGLPHAK